MDLRYELLNKDTVVCTFELDYWNGIDDVKDIRIIRKDLTRFIGDSLLDFLNSRKAPEHRENIKKLLRQYNCDNLYGFLETSHALSLIDTFWVRRYGSNLTWDKASLYRNKFSKVVARIAFEGGLRGKELYTTSPEYVTDGAFAKCWLRSDKHTYLVKAGSSGALNAGKEPYSEVMASQLIDILGVNHAKYKIGTVRGRLVSKCEIFTNEDIGFLPMYKYINKSNVNLGQLMKFFYNNDKEIYNSLIDMIMVDSVIMNDDRHLGNFGVLVNNDTQEKVGFAPLFDHNISMLCYAIDSELSSIEEYKKYLKELNKGHKLENNIDGFNELARKWITQEWRNRLKKLIGFRFDKSKLRGMKAERINNIEKIIQYNIKEILK